MGHDQPRGVSIDFLTGAIKLLSKIHGPKMAGERTGIFVEGLKIAEQAYLESEDEPPKSRRKSKRQAGK